MLGTRCMVVLSSPDAIKELLDKRGNIYSSRPESHIVSTATNGLNLVMMVSALSRIRDECIFAQANLISSGIWRKLEEMP